MKHTRLPKYAPLTFKYSFHRLTKASIPK